MKTARGFVIAALSALLLAVLPASARPASRLLHVVDCDFSGDRCMVHQDLSFDAASMSDAEVTRQIDARSGIIESARQQRAMLAEGDRLVKLNSALMCHKITREEYAEAKASGATVEDVYAGAITRPVEDGGVDCSFGSPNCPNFMTYFKSPAGDYCMAAAVNCIRPSKRR